MISKHPETYQPNSTALVSIFGYHISQHLSSLKINCRLHYTHHTYHKIHINIIDLQDPAPAPAPAPSKSSRINIKLRNQRTFQVNIRDTDYHPFIHRFILRISNLFGRQVQGTISCQSSLHYGVQHTGTLAFFIQIFQLQRIEISPIPSVRESFLILHKTIVPSTIDH